MSKRSRLLAWLAGTALLAGAVIVLRVPESAPDEAEPPAAVDRFAADLVVLPGPSQPPQQPPKLSVVPDDGRLRVYWADGLVGGEPLSEVVGYEVTWERIDGEGEVGSRLVVAPDMVLDGLVDGERYRIRVRSIDAFGQRSVPTEATGQPRRGHAHLGLTETYDDFTDPATVEPGSPASRWHVSSYRGCAELESGDRGLTIALSCTTDVAVLRARAPLRLAGGEELGRVAVLTDTAGPGGELTIDLVPGPADRVGVGTRRTVSAERGDPGLPGGTVRVAFTDGEVLVNAAPDVPVEGPTAHYQRVPRRGPGVPHLFEVALTTSGVRVYQDGMAVALRKLRPTWREASVLLGFRGPDDRPSRVTVSAVGLSGPRRGPGGVVEAPVRPTTRRVLGLTELAPDGGMPRKALTGAKSAKVVMTVATNPELDLPRAQVQLGTARLPVRPAVAVPPRTNGASLTLVADVPPPLLGAKGPATIEPFVLRIPGADTSATVVETYLEITPTPAWRDHHPTRDRELTPLPDGLPVVELTFGDSAGDPLPSRTLPAQGQVLLTVSLRATAAQWDTGAVAGVRGLEVFLDGELIAGLPTEADGPGVGGVYPLPMAVGDLAPGDHVIEVRQYPVDGEPQTARLGFDVAPPS